jgi:hypothetical protein
MNIFVQIAIKKWVQVAETTFEIPEDLVKAIEMGSFERQLPKQGDRDVMRYLMDPTDGAAAEKAKKWIEGQKGVWQEVDDVVRRLHQVSPLNGPTPAWSHHEWWLVLCMPWSQDLTQAVRDANAWCDKQPLKETIKNAESS